MAHRENLWSPKQKVVGRKHNESSAHVGIQWPHPPNNSEGMLYTNRAFLLLKCGTVVFIYFFVSGLFDDDLRLCGVEWWMKWSWPDNSTCAAYACVYWRQPQNLSRVGVLA
jgi:hypothetical protein